MQPISVYRQQKSRPPGKQLVAAAATFCAVVALLLLLPGEQAEAKLFENFMDAHAVNLLHAAAISGSTAVAQLICSR